MGSRHPGAEGHIRAFSEIARLAAEGRDIALLLDAACSYIQGSFHHRLAAVWLLDAEDELSLRAAEGPGAAGLGRAPAEEAARACLTARPSRTGTGGLALPLAFGGRTVGALVVEPAEGENLDERDVLALEGLAAQLAAAASAAEAREEARRGRLEAESLREASAALNASLDLEEVLRRILDGISRVLEIDSASIMLREGDRVSFVSSRGVSEGEIGASYPPLERLHYVRKVLVERRPIIIADTRGDPDWFGTPGNAYIRSWIGVPLLVKGDPIGLLTLDSRKPGYWTGHHAILAAGFAGQAAIAIENARLYREEERRRREAEILRDVSAAANASLDPARTLELILDGLAKVIDYDSASIMEKRGERIEIVASRWPRNRVLLDPDADFSYLPNVLKALASPRPLIVPDTALDPLWQGLRIQGDDYIRCWIGVPLRFEGKTIGLLNVDHHQAGFYGPHELALAEGFGNSVATALQNARLYAQARQEIEERRLADARTQRANQEKLEFLSSLVAVIAHEVNTPAGVAITAASHLQGLLADVRRGYAEGTIDEEEFLRGLDEGDEAIGIVGSNLRRVAELIRTFRKIAVDQHLDERRRFKARDQLEAVLLSMKPRLREGGHEVAVSCPGNLAVTTNPGAFSQILVNLIANSLVHAFPEGRRGRIEIDIAARGPDLGIRYADDGVGIPEENLELVWKPFFTTARSRGGTGLGLYIVENLVAKLGGTVACESGAGKGVRFRIELPGVEAAEEGRDGR